MNKQEKPWKLFLQNSKKRTKEFFHVVGINTRLCPYLLPVNIGKNILIAAVPYVGIWYGCLILDGLLQGKGSKDLMPYVVYLAVISMILTLSFYALARMGNTLRDNIRYRMQGDLANKACSLDYGQLENQETMALLAAAEEGESASGGIYEFSDRLGTLVGDIASVVYGFVLLYPLLFHKNPETHNIYETIFTSQISIYMLFLLDIICMFSFFVISSNSNEKQYKIYENSLDATRKDDYYYREILGQYHYGKEIRLYNMQENILEDMKSIWKQKCDMDQQRTKVGRIMEGKFILIQMGLLFVAYIMVGSRGVLGYISPAEVVKYVSVFTALAGAFEMLVSHYTKVLINVRYLDNYYVFLNIPSANGTGHEKVDLKHLDKLVFQFHNVTFRYPNSDKDSLKNVNITFDFGEKTAIVGENGAGKTTLIMLMCGLYQPTKGYITLNEIPIQNYEVSSYRELFGIVFQDFKLFAMNIGENVATSGTYQEELVIQCLKKAGIYQRVEQMESGIKTHLYNVGEKGVEISGGEAQKIAIARALYKNPPIIILDEPTSALDPLSEYEIYSGFDKLVENKTAIYISHRMSSCRFCDRIIVLNHGGVEELGSHEELLGQQGMYASLWEAQAQYYQ